MFSATRNCHNKIVELLAFRGADVHLRDSFGWTSLIFAAYVGQVPSIETFVAFDAEINAVNGHLRSALMWAAQQGRIEAVRLLLSLNADTTKCDDTGKTAFDLAMSDQMKELFLEHEKKVRWFFCLFVFV